MFVNDNGYGDDLYDVEGTEYELVATLAQRLRKLDIITDNEYILIDRDTGEIIVAKR